MQNIKPEGFLGVNAAEQFSGATGLNCFLGTKAVKISQPLPKK